MTEQDSRLPTFADIEAAAERIAGRVRRTPVLRDEVLDELAGCRLLFKCEHLQRVGAFKYRGATNAVLSLSDEEAAHGVVTQSSGNHGAAIALACRERRITATVVMPRATPTAKRDNVLRYGARIVDCDTGQAARDAVTADVLRDTGATLIHPFNDARIIAGQGTAAREFLQQLAEANQHIDTIMAPVSGGGLLSGTALAAKSMQPDIRVVGAEPAQAADAYESFHRGERITNVPIDTICDGLRATLGPLPFALLQQHCDDILLASEAQIIDAMRLVWTHLKQTIEPSSAVPLAVVLANPDAFAGRDVGIILSGGNVDLDRLPWMVDANRAA
ncbi:MAG: pyridoxal-phosphate dependent enzyme [Lysobacteraceae bacterium]